jgi:hypothetical protein
VTRPSPTTAPPDLQREHSLSPASCLKLTSSSLLDSPLPLHRTSALHVPMVPFRNVVSLCLHALHILCPSPSPRIRIPTMLSSPHRTHFIFPCPSTLKSPPLCAHLPREHGHGSHTTPVTAPDLSLDRKRHVSPGIPMPTHLSPSPRTPFSFVTLLASSAAVCTFWRYPNLARTTAP